MKVKKNIKVYKDGEPCDHIGCMNHISHPCEKCGRIGARGEFRVIQVVAISSKDASK